MKVGPGLGQCKAHLQCFKTSRDWASAGDGLVGIIVPCLYSPHGWTGAGPKTQLGSPGDLGVRFGILAKISGQDLAQDFG